MLHSSITMQKHSNWHASMSIGVFLHLVLRVYALILIFHNLLWCSNILSAANGRAGRRRYSRNCLKIKRKSSGIHSLSSFLKAAYRQLHPWKVFRCPCIGYLFRIPSWCGGLLWGKPVLVYLHHHRKNMRSVFWECLSVFFEFVSQFEE